jgi:hypothetical protein
MLLISCLFTICAILGLTARLEYHEAIAYHKLAQTVSSVTNITIYDLNSHTADTSSIALSSVASAQFPVQVFTSAAGTSEHHIWGLWKGSPLVILTLNDGSQQRARFSYYGGFFGLDGVDGIYVVNGGQHSEFFTNFQSALNQLSIETNNLQKMNK